MIVGPKDLQGNMITGIGMILIFLIIGKFTVGLNTPFAVFLFVIIACIMRNEINSLVPYISAFHKKSDVDKYGDKAKKCIKASMKKFYSALVYFVVLPIIVAFIIKLVLSAATDINKYIISYVAIISMYFIYGAVKVLYKFEPKEIEFNYYKTLTQEDPNNVKAYYNLAALSAVMMKTDECLESLRAVVKLDKKYVELIHEDKCFAMNNIRNTDEFRDIVR